MKKMLVMAACVAAGLSSCSQNEVLDNAIQQERNAINFGVYTGKQTKGLVTTSATIKTGGFGVYGFYTAGADWENTDTPNFMFNQQVTHSGESWIYSPVKYWPNDQAEKISFFAYAPYSTNAESGITTVSDKATADAPTLKFTINPSADAMVDFVCGQNMNVTKGSATPTAVEFNLKHQLARATFSAKTNITGDTYQEENTYAVITGMQLKEKTNGFYSSAEYKFATTATNSTVGDVTGNGTWDLTTTGDTPKAVLQASKYNLSSVLNQGTASTSGMLDQTSLGGYTTAGIRVQNNKDAVKLFTDNQYLFLIPNNAIGLAVAGDVTVELTYQIVTIDDKLEAGHVATTSKTFDVKLPAGTLKQGKAYLYTLTIQLDEVEVDATVVKCDTDNTETPTTEE